MRPDNGEVNEDISQSCEGRQETDVTTTVDDYRVTSGDFFIVRVLPGRVAALSGLRDKPADGRRRHRVAVPSLASLPVAHGAL